MTSLRPLGPICTLLTGAGCSFALGCGGDDGLIAAKNASEINRHLDELRSAVDSGQCTAAAAAIRQVQADVQNLPGSVDASLRRQIRAGYRKLAGTYGSDCQRDRQTVPQPQTVVPQAAPTPHPGPKPHPRKPRGPKPKKAGKPGHGRARGHARLRATEYGQ